MSKPASYREATLRVHESKARLLSSLGNAKARVAPGRLMADAKAGAVSAIMDIPALAVAKARQRPAAVGAASVAFLLYLFRRPLGTLFGRLYVRWKNRNPETDNG